MKKLCQVCSVATVVTIVTFLLSAPAESLAGDVVVPNEVEFVEGNTNNIFPFSMITSMRYQQIYGSADFAGVTGPVEITELRFRPDGEFGRSFSTFLPDIEVRLSTTLVAVDQLSTTFADNIGSDETVVHSGGIRLSSSATGAGPLDFDIVIPLSTPFLYDPAEGNLLMDVTNFEGYFTSPFDAHAPFGDAASRTFIQGDAYSPEAEYRDTWGLVTKFVYVDPTIPVAIDVTPDLAKNFVKLNSNSKGKSAEKLLPVAILTTEDYDATDTDVTTVLLGDPDLSGTASPTQSSVADVDDDGDNDLLLQFSLQDMVDLSAVDEFSELLFLTGETQEGIPIEGLDFITIK